MNFLFASARPFAYSSAFPSGLVPREAKAKEVIMMARDMGVAMRCARGHGFLEPRAAANVVVGVRDDFIAVLRSLGINDRFRGVWLKAIRAPFIHIPQHIKKPEAVRRLPADLVRQVA